MVGRAVGSFSFVGEAVTMDLGEPDYTPASLIVWKNGRVGAGISSRAGISIYDTEEIERPESLTMDQLMKLIKARVPKDYAINKRYYKGDHWQAGRGWSGPMPDRSDPTYGIIFDQVKKAFRSKNAVKEVVRRHMNGAIGKEPAWYYIIRDDSVTALPTVSSVRKARALALTDYTRQQQEAQAARAAQAATEVDPANLPAAQADLPVEIPEPELDPAMQTLMQIEQAVTRWWDKRKIVEIMQEETVTALLGGRAMLRIFIPSGALGADGTLASPPESFSEALDYLFVHEVAMDKGAVLTDASSMQEVGVYAFARPDGSRYGEIAYILGFGDDAVTVVATIDTNSRDARKPPAYKEVPRATSSATYNLGGRLPMFEITREALISEQVRQQQDAINEACTMARVNGQVAGFLERTVLNGQVPGYYVKDPTTGKHTFVRTEYQTGAGAINFIAGVPQYDADGVFKGLTSPSIVYKDPTPPDVFDKTLLMAYRDLLDEVDQVHHLLTSDNYVSAESRKQARADFVTSLRSTRDRLNQQGRWLLETIYAYAYDLLDETTRQREQLPTPQELSVVFATQLDAGPASAEEVRGAIEIRTAKLASRQTTQMAVGIEDTDAENTLIAQDEAAGVPWPGSGAGGQPSDGGRTAGTLSSERMQKDGVRTASEEQR